MIKESKYIIRRIIIGVGIALCLAFLNGCKVKAYNIDLNIPVTYNYNTNSFYDNNSNYNLITSITRHNVNKTSYIYSDNDNNLIVSNNECTAIFDLTSYGANLSQVLILTNTVNSGANTYDGIYIIDNNYSHGVFSKNNGNNISIEINYYNNTSDIVALYKYLDSFGPSTEGGGCYYGQTGYGLPDYTSSDYREIPIQNNKTLDSVVLANGMPIFDYNNQSEILKEIYVGSTSTPEFLSFNASKTVHNNLLLGYTFAPEFSVFDTDNYEYQYRIGLNDIWLTMNENLYEFNVNANTTVYVRIKDKSNNEIIYSSTFTITGVGDFYDSNVDYDIKFNGKYRTQNYLNNNSSGSSIIQEYEIDVTFSPDSSILKYQYQYVLNGNSIDNNGWIDVSLQPSSMGNFTTVVSQNGTLYARILDSSDNVMATGSFTVNSIGKIAFDNSDDKILNKYNNILNSINFGGPISGLIDIPIKVIGTISTGLSGGLTCSDYQLGKLMGTNLKLPCVNVKSHLGESLYFTIDIILSACMAYHIIKMIFDFYNNLLFMEKHPIEDLGRRR